MMTPTIIEDQGNNARLTFEYNHHEVHNKARYKRHY